MFRVLGLIALSQVNRHWIYWLRSEGIMQSLQTHIGGFFAIGDQLDAQDRCNKWYGAEVVDRTSTHILVHFLGWGSRWDEWIEHSDIDRLAPWKTQNRALTPAERRLLPNRQHLTFEVQWGGPENRLFQDLPTPARALRNLAHTAGREDGPQDRDNPGLPRQHGQEDEDGSDVDPGEESADEDGVVRRPHRRRSLQRHMRLFHQDDPGGAIRDPLGCELSCPATSNLISSTCF